ncbi:MAG TPA: helix-turn-helix domain-containing protein, partial [Pseudorhodoferax sp.]|nr:helix-turn-helix domain-containing protein [Pseudorhodoferax sp.]
ASRFERNHLTIARSGIDDVLVLVYLSGAFTYEVNGRVRDVQAHEIAFFDLTRPFSIQSVYVDNLSLAVSRRRLAELMPSPVDFHGFVLRQGAMHRLLLAHLQNCNEMAPQIGTDESQAVSDATLHLVVAGLQSAKHQAAATATHVGLASLTEMKDFIEDQLGRTDLGPDDLVKAFNLSRAALYRLFEPLGGVSAFILDRRLERALQTITAPQAARPSLKQLAHDLGFAHQTSFTRAFKKRFGIPPHEVRALRRYPGEVQSAAWRLARARHLPLMAVAKSSDG